MSTPSDREKRLCEMFDSYCKSVLGNTSKYMKAELQATLIYAIKNWRELI